MEKLGIPTAATIRPEMSYMAINGMMGANMPPEVPWVLLPWQLYLPDSDVPGIITPAKIQLYIDCLVGGRPNSWKPSQTWTKGQVITKPMAKFTGKDYPEALQNWYNMSHQNLWSTGLSLVPPTKDRVDWILTGMPPGKKRDDRVGGGTGYVQTQNGILTYEGAAVALAMAGGRPEHLCVVCAAFEVIIPRESDTIASSGSNYPITMVGGPIARDVRVSNGFGMWGPDPKHSNSTLKNAIWLIYQNVGGLVSGHGAAGQYSEIRPGMCFAENEQNLPAGWTTYAEEYFQKSKGTNCVMYLEAGLSTGVVGWSPRGPGNESLAEEVEESFDRMRQVIKRSPTSGVPRDSAGSAGMLLIPANLLVTYYAAHGYTKQSFKQKLADKLWYSIEEVKDVQGVLQSCASSKVDINTLPAKIKLMTNPQNINLVGAGGDHPSAARWIPSISRAGAADIVKPSNWDKLMADAEIDLGPLPPLAESGCDA